MVGALYTSQMALLALAQDTASLYICVANCDTFGALVTVLATHQLSLVGAAALFYFSCHSSESRLTAEEIEKYL